MIMESCVNNFGVGTENKNHRERAVKVRSLLVYTMILPQSEKNIGKSEEKKSDCA